MQSINLYLFSLLNAGHHLAEWTLILMIFLAQYLVYVVPIILVVLWLFGPTQFRGTLILSTLVAIFALTISFIIAHFWYQPRPFVLGLGNTYITHAPDSTFPSDHTTFISAVGFGFLIQQRLRLIGVILLFISLVVGWARIFLGVHFPFDIIGAILLSFISFLILYPFQILINSKILPIAEKFYRIIFAFFIKKGLIRK